MDKQDPNVQCSELFTVQYPLINHKGKYEKEYIHNTITLLYIRN